MGEGEQRLLTWGLTKLSLGKVFGGGYCRTAQGLWLTTAHSTAARMVTGTGALPSLLVPLPLSGSLPLLGPSPGLRQIFTLKWRQKEGTIL